MQVSMKKWWIQSLQFTAAVAFMAAAFFAGRQAAVTVSVTNQETDAKAKYCVVVDAGHGGDDPGKVGINGMLEKELNLQIAKKLAVFLEMADVEVVMTRTEDRGLHEEGTSGKKAQDMKRRVELMETHAPDLVISIHQNSYGDETVRGAQVFYYTGSAEGKKLAQILQHRLVEGLDPANHRMEKDNDSYYLLKKTSRPIVIAECGFLSNPDEATLLCDPLYQEKAAWHLHMGIMQYLNDI